MEVKREALIERPDRRDAPVSILVLMEVKREAVRGTAVRIDTAVSILVLMEVKRESPRPTCWIFGKISFNPCFDGSEARASARLTSHSSAIRFQSLF